MRVRRGRRSSTRATTSIADATDTPTHAAAKDHDGEGWSKTHPAQAMAPTEATTTGTLAARSHLTSRCRRFHARAPAAPAKNAPARVSAPMSTQVDSDPACRNTITSANEAAASAPAAQRATRRPRATSRTKSGAQTR